MSQLWNKGYNVNDEIIKFTVGNDYELDQKMVKQDALGSAAHALMLKKIGILNKTETDKLLKELKNIVDLDKKGKFKVKQEQEDVHTAIENHLVEKLGSLGKKIHTARSRNDQVVVNTRLYNKEKLQDIYNYTLSLAEVIYKFAKKYEKVPLPGYTHMQRAMPSSVDMWAGSFLEAILDDLKVLKMAYEINDQCPLGSAAGFGVNLNIDREYTSKLLGFKKLQNNSMYVSYGRGKIDAHVLYALYSVMNTMAKMANDILMFSMSEFQFIKLPDQFCTGSSIMPQKKNGDVFELTRGKCKVMLGYLIQEIEIFTPLLSGYNRDTQLTKEPLVKGLELAENTIKIMSLTVNGLEVNKENCVKALSPDIFATDYALDLVKKGMPFRDAYRDVAKHIKELKAIDPNKNILEKNHVGATGNLRLSLSKKELEKQNTWIKNEQNNFDKIQGKLLKK
jgi:argininosuccinate lyase